MGRIAQRGIGKQRGASQAQLPRLIACFAEAAVAESERGHAYRERLVAGIGQ